MTKKRRKGKRRPSPRRSAANVLPRPIAQLDVVVPVYGRPDMLRQCLEALERTGKGVPMSLTVVDDKGPDQEELQEIYGSLPIHAKLVRNAENMGFPYSANTGAAQGKAPFVVFLSTDIVLHDGCLQAMLAEMAANPKTGVVGAKLIFPEVSDDPGRPVGKIQHAGLCVDVQGNVTHANIGWGPDHKKVCQRRVLQAVTGGLLMTRRETWQKVCRYYKSIDDPSNGAFNLVYGRGTYEDVEYCIAARGNGYEVVYVPEAVATHHVGASVSLCKQGFALGRNATVFKARCGHMLHWDMWRYC
jgi:GT2 family glycosyltransferase